MKMIGGLFILYPIIRRPREKIRASISPSVNISIAFRKMKGRLPLRQCSTAELDLRKDPQSLVVTSLTATMRIPTIAMTTTAPRSPE